MFQRITTVLLTIFVMLVSFISPAMAANSQCFSFSNPDSINGPFGTLQLELPSTSGDVSGEVTIDTLFGLGTETKLDTTGTCDDNQDLICKMEGKGYLTSIGNPPKPVTMAMTLDLDSSRDKGFISFKADLPETFGNGLPVTKGCTK